MKKWIWMHIQLLPVCILGVLAHAVASENACTAIFAQTLINGECRGSLVEETLNAAVQACSQCNPPSPGQPSPPSPPSSAASSSNKQKTTLLVLAIVLPTAVCILLLGGFCMHEMSGRAGRTLLGRVKAPGATEDSTLVLTDIQDSTSLWEALDEGVMDTAIALHHAAFRRLIAKHSGYEAQVEGDSFCVAFHTPLDATRFCIAVQVDLLTLDWPPELLALDSCKPIYSGRATGLEYGATLSRNGGTGQQSPLPHVIRSPLGSRQLDMTTGTSQHTAGGTPPVNSSAANALPLSSDTVLDVNNPTAALPPAGGDHAVQCTSTSQPSGGVPQDLAQKLLPPGQHVGFTGSSPAYPVVADSSTAGVWDDGAGAHGKSRLGGSTAGEAGEAGLGAERTASAGDVHSAVLPSAGGLRPLSISIHASTKQPASASESATLQRHQHDPPTPTKGHFTPDAPSTQVANSGLQQPARSPLRGQAGDAVGVIRGSKGGALVAAAGHEPSPAYSDSPLHKLTQPLLNATASALAAAPSFLGLQTVAKRMVGGLQGEVVDFEEHKASATMGRQLSMRPGGVSAEGTGAGGDGTSAIGSMAGLPQTMTVGETLLLKWVLVDASFPGATLMFRGLRVRMGTSTGLRPSDCELNKTAGRMHYTGHGLLVAKAVCDAACGGMILACGETHERLFMDAVHDSERMMVLHMGEHLLHVDLPPTTLHQLCPRPLMGRLMLLPGVRSHRQQSLGVLEAPAGLITVVFMHVVGAKTLMDWDPIIASQSLALFEERAMVLLHKYGGYLVECAEGFVLASFARPAAAVRWAMQCNRDMVKIAWPEELLGHELGEELVSQVVDEEGRVAEVVAMRGLRLKAGLDCGRLRGEINCVTGRMTYRGRYMNRAARIVGAAGSGQVLASADVWSRCEGQPFMSTLSAASMGLYRLRGVAEPIGVFHIKARSDTLTTKRASLMLARDSCDVHSDIAPSATVHRAPSGTLPSPSHGPYHSHSHSFGNPKGSVLSQFGLGIAPGARRKSYGPLARQSVATSHASSTTSRHPSRAHSFGEGLLATSRRSLLMLVPGQQHYPPGNSQSGPDTSGMGTGYGSRYVPTSHASSRRGSVGVRYSSSSGGVLASPRTSASRTSDHATLPTLAGVGFGALGAGGAVRRGSATSAVSRLDQDLRGYSLDFLAEEQYVHGGGGGGAVVVGVQPSPGRTLTALSGEQFAADPVADLLRQEEEEDAVRVMGGSALLLVSGPDATAASMAAAANAGASISAVAGAQHMTGAQRHVSADGMRPSGEDCRAGGEAAMVREAACHEGGRSASGAGNAASNQLLAVQGAQLMTDMHGNNLVHVPAAAAVSWQPGTRCPAPQAPCLHIEITAAAAAGDACLPPGRPMALARSPELYSLLTTANDGNPAASLAPRASIATTHTTTTTTGMAGAPAPALATGARHRARRVTIEPSPVTAVFPASPMGSSGSMGTTEPRAGSSAHAFHLPGPYGNDRDGEGGGAREGGVSRAGGSRPREPSGARDPRKRRHKSLLLSGAAALRAALFSHSAAGEPGSRTSSQDGCNSSQAGVSQRSISVAEHQMPSRRSSVRALRLLLGVGGGSHSFSSQVMRGRGTRRGSDLSGGGPLSSGNASPIARLPSAHYHHAISFQPATSTRGWGQSATSSLSVTGSPPLGGQHMAHYHGSAESTGCMPPSTASSHTRVSSTAMQQPGQPSWGQAQAAAGGTGGSGTHAAVRRRPTRVASSLLGAPAEMLSSVFRRRSLLGPAAFAQAASGGLASHSGPPQVADGSELATGAPSRHVSAWSTGRSSVHLAVRDECDQGGNLLVMQGDDSEDEAGGPSGLIGIATPMEGYDDGVGDGRGDVSGRHALGAGGGVRQPAPRWSDGSRRGSYGTDVPDWERERSEAQRSLTHGPMLAGGASGLRASPPLGAAWNAQYSGFHASSSFMHMGSSTLGPMGEEHEGDESLEGLDDDLPVAFDSPVTACTLHSLHSERPAGHVAPPSPAVIGAPAAAAAQHVLPITSIELGPGYPTHPGAGQWQPFARPVGITGATASQPVMQRVLSNSAQAATTAGAAAGNLHMPPVARRAGGFGSQSVPQQASGMGQSGATTGSSGAAVPRSVAGVPPALSRSSRLGPQPAQTCDRFSDPSTAAEPHIPAAGSGGDSVHGARVASAPQQHVGLP